MSDRYRIFPQRGFDKEYSLLVRCADNCSRTLLVHVNSFTNSHALRRRICSSFAHVWLGLSFLLPTAMLIYSMHLRLMLLRYLFWQREYMCDLLAARDRYCSLGFHIGGWHTQEQRGGVVGCCGCRTRETCTAEQEQSIWSDKEAQNNSMKY